MGNIDAKKVVGKLLENPEQYWDFFKLTCFRNVFWFVFQTFNKTQEAQPKNGLEIWI